MMLDEEKAEILSDIFHVTIHKDLPIEPGDLYFGQGGDNLFQMLTCKRIDEERQLVIPTKELGECFFIWNCVKITRNEGE